MILQKDAVVLFTIYLLHHIRHDLLIEQNLITDVHQQNETSKL